VPAVSTTGARLETHAELGHHADDPIASTIRSSPPAGRCVRFGWFSRRWRMACRYNAVGLRARCAHRRPLRRIEDAKLDAGFVGGSAIAPPSASISLTRCPCRCRRSTDCRTSRPGFRCCGSAAGCAQPETCGAWPPHRRKLETARGCPNKKRRLGAGMAATELFHDGLAIKARARASICRSPPESVPACCPRRSFKRGKIANTSSMV
jgi:hypothetical protein